MDVGFLKDLSWRASIFLHLSNNPILQYESASEVTTEPPGHGFADPSPLTLSAGQTLTLGQMDNGLFALSPSEHTPPPCPGRSLSFHLLLPFLSPFILPLLLLIT